MTLLLYLFAGNDKAREIMTEVLKLLKSINASDLDTGGEGTDIAFWMQAGVPGASLKNDAEKYFYFHHTNGRFGYDKLYQTKLYTFILQIANIILNQCILSFERNLCQN